MLSSLLSDPSGSPFFLYCGLDSLPLSASQSEARRLPAPLFPRLAASSPEGLPGSRVLPCPCPAPSATSSATDICIPRRVWSNISRVSRPPSRHYQGFFSAFKWWF
ncbi:hypothetical protein QQF64_030836 [Cirrhinus molitorella]|uniref:Uncharacterized protein n=2 Tax=Cirrhinus molitorella TaxID=172907 RepID=A0ABR3N4H2_9TELE|nr:hypothetical protein Q8A67_001828 [Cirrhinus molitorella]